MKSGVSAALVCVLAGGCIPFHVPDTPPVSGQVLDQDSHQPLAGARINIQPIDYKDSSPIGSAVNTATDENGRFAAKETYRTVWLPPLPFDFFYPRILIDISAGGYQAHAFADIDLGRVTPDLQRSADGATFYLKHE